VQDVQLWNQGRLLNNYAPRAELLTADAITLFLENQKNGQKGATIHHTAVDGWFCPVKALACRVSDMGKQGLNPSTPLSCVSLGNHIASPSIVSTIQEALRLTHLPDHNYDLKCIRVHSLQASGAMAMKLKSVDAETIKKVGHWTSSTFLMYMSTCRLLC
jgi:hypothetical protein